MADVTFDIEDVTLGELWEVEKASGEDVQTLLRTAMGRRMLGLFLSEYRDSGKPPSWSDIASRRIVGGRSSASPSASDGLPQRSSD